MTHYLLSCDHVIERDSKPPKLVRCSECPKTNDGNPKRRLIGECTPDGLQLDDYSYEIGDQHVSASPTSRPAGSDTLTDVDFVAQHGMIGPRGEVRVPPGAIDADPASDEQRERYDAAIAAGASEDEAVEAAVVADENVVMTAAALLQRYRDAKIEHQLLRTWNAQPESERGEQPATPALDALLADHAAGIRAEDRIVRSTSSSRQPKPAKPAPVLPAGAVQLFRNGSPLRGKHNRLSSLAGYCKIPIAELRLTLTAAGIESPETTAWEITLANGTKLAATITGEVTA